MGLSAKQQKFIEELLVCGNRADAYERAFGQRRTRAAARQAAYKCLQNPAVREYYEEQKRLLNKDRIADAEEILRGFTEIFRREKPDYVVTNSGGVLEVPPKIADIIHAGEQILKRLDAAGNSGGSDKYGVVIMPEIKEE